MINSIKCILGFHDWNWTGGFNEFQSMNYKCSRCELIRSLKPVNQTLPGWVYLRRSSASSKTGE